MLNETDGVLPVALYLAERHESGIDFLIYLLKRKWIRVFSKISNNSFKDTTVP